MAGLARWCAKCGGRFDLDSVDLPAARCLTSRSGGWFASTPPKSPAGSTTHSTLNTPATGGRLDATSRHLLVLRGAPRCVAVPTEVPATDWTYEGRAEARQTVRSR